MAYNFSSFKDGSTSVINWLQKEYTAVRTGRATPSILDTVSVDAYGSKMTVKELATISVEDPKTLRIVPWDKAILKSLDSALRESNLGFSVSVDAEGVRVSFPELTADRRSMLIKLSKDKLEEARISLRGEREKVQNNIEKEVADGNLTEDDKFRLKTELQKMVDETNNKLEEIYKKKEKEIQE